MQFNIAVMIRTMAKLFRQAQLIAAKDMKLFVKDRFALLFALGFPLLFVAAFSLLLGNVGPQDQRLVLTVATEEGLQGVSHQIIDALGQQPSIDLRVVDPASAREAVEAKKLDGFLLFPANFTSDLLAGKQAHLTVVAQANAPDTEAALQGIAQAIATKVTYAVATYRALQEIPGTNPGLVLGNGSEVTQFGGPDLITFQVDRIGEARPFNPSNFTLPGYLTMFVFFAAALGAEAIAKERTQQTLERLASNGMTRGALVLGKFTGFSYKGLLQISLLWLFGIFVFKINFGTSPLVVVLVSVIVVFTSSAFGVMLASLVKTERAGGSAAVLASLTLAPLGGSWWPLYITPQWMQELAKLTPHGWANEAFDKLMLFGASFGDVVTEMIALVMFGVAFLAIALWRFRISAAQ